MVVINTGDGPNTGTGDALVDAMTIVNENFAELAALIEEKLSIGEPIPLSAVTGLQTALNALQTNINANTTALDGKAGVDAYDQINDIQDNQTGMLGLIQSQQATITEMQNTLNYILSIIT